MDVDVLAVGLAEFGLAFGAFLVVLDVVEPVAVDRVDRRLGPHDRDLAGGEAEGRFGVVGRSRHGVDPRTVGLPDDHTLFRDRRRRGGVDHLLALFEDPLLLDPRPRHEPRRVTEVEEWNIVGVALPDELGGLLGRVGEDRARAVGGLVRHDPHRSAVDTAEGGDDLGTELGTEFEGRALVRDAFDHVVHVVAPVRPFGHHRVDAGGRARGRAGVGAWRLLVRVVREVGDELGDQLAGVFFVAGHQIRTARFGRVDLRPAELLEVDLLAGDHLDHPG